MALKERNWTVRDFKKGDEKKIVDLWNLTYGDLFTKDFWDWKYKQNPLGFKKERTVLAQSETGEVIGTYSLLPNRSKLGTEEVFITQDVDLVTHPDHQRKGIYANMCERLTSNADTLENHWTYAYPDIQTSSYGGHIKMGWKDVLHVDQLTCVLNPRAFVVRRDIPSWKKLAIKNYIRIAKRPRPPHPEKGVKVETIDSFGKDTDDLWDRVSEDLEVSVCRDKDHMNWRCSNPLADYIRLRAVKGEETIGHCILVHRNSMGMHQGYILDCMTLGEESGSIRALMAWTFEWARKNSLDTLRFWTPRWHRYNNALRMYGFFHKSTKIAMTLRKNTKEKRVEDDALFSKEKWYYSMLDTDHI